MLGLGISAATIPLAITQGLRARRVEGGRRRMAVAGLILGLFACFIPTAQVANTIRALVYPAPPPEEAPPPVACDCVGRVTGATLELRLVAAGGDGLVVSERGSGETLVLERDALVTLDDLLAALPLETESGRVQLSIKMAAPAAERLARRATPGSRLAVLVGGECVLVSTVLSPLPADMMLQLHITVEEACAVHCSVPPPVSPLPAER